MGISSKLDVLFLKAKANKWLNYFAVFNRIALAAGFLPAGYVKIIGERFTDLSINHPMGNYLEALHHTGYYYTFIGIAQITAALLLLVPRTATLGALLYFPIILNICILSFAVRFEGSMLTAPLMVMANLYLLCWDYDKLKSILAFHPPGTAATGSIQKGRNNQFPTLFFTAVLAIIVIVVLIFTHGYDMMPRDTLAGCMGQCKDNQHPKATAAFCDCIHKQGQPLEQCLEAYHKAINDTVAVK